MSKKTPPTPKPTPPRPKSNPEPSKREGFGSMPKYEIPPPPPPPKKQKCVWEDKVEG
jgi:hypothetical protein